MFFKLKKITSITVSILLCAGCKPLSPHTTIFLGNSSETVKITDCAQKAKITLLSEKEEYPIGEIGKICSNDDFYFFTDKSNTRLFKYNNNGDFISCFNRKGHAKNEYLNILDFDIDDKFIYLLCIPNKVIKTNHNFEIQEIVNLMGSYTHIAVHNTSLYLYEQNLNGRNLVMLGKDKQITPILSEPPLPACPKTSNVLFKSDRNLFFISHGGEKVYLIDGIKTKPIINIDYKEKENTLKRYAQDKIITGTEHMLYPSPHIYSFLELKDTYMIIYSYKMVFNVCEILKETLEITHDGTALFYGALPIYQCNNRFLSAGFMTYGNKFFGTEDIQTEYIGTPNPEYGNAAIIEINFLLQ